MKSLQTGLLALLLCFSVNAQATDVIGNIRTFQGSATIQRGKQIVPVSVGAPLYREDLVRTAKPGAVGIVLTDDTTISLGPNSELALNDYRFEPKDGKFSLVARMARGTFSYISGLIGKLSPQSVILTIPDATIAIRGTKLLISVEE